ncbi:MAG: metalloprotease family protein [Zestosphaera sp.]
MVVVMNCGENNCIAKRDVVLLLGVAGALVMGFLALSSLNSFAEMMIVSVMFVSLTLVHEVIHYLVLRLLGRRARIWILARYGALVVDYLDELSWKELTYTYLAPQALITLPLLLTHAVTGYVFTYVLLVLHLAASTPDILNMLRILIVFRSSKFKLCKEGRKVVGFTVTKPSGDCIIYKLF